ncbi:MAG: hypothetical protein U0Q18_11455 [Bryobacteraceae bacterium]
MSIIKTICIAILLPCLVGQVFAANSDWAAVQGLAAGQPIRVQLTTGKTLNGTVDRVTPEAIYVQTRTQSTEIRRDEINRIALKKKRNWALPVLVGAGAGAAVGGVAGSQVMERESGYGGAVAGTAVAGAAIGALIGYAAKGSGQTLVYEARR